MSQIADCARPNLLEFDQTLAPRVLVMQDWVAGETISRYSPRVLSVTSLMTHTLALFEVMDACALTVELQITDTLK